MADEQLADEALVAKAVTFKLYPADIRRLRALVKWRFPEDTHMTSKTVRDLIREAYERERPDHSTSAK